MTVLYYSCTVPGGNYKDRCKCTLCLVLKLGQFVYNTQRFGMPDSSRTAFTDTLCHMMSVQISRKYEAASSECHVQGQPLSAPFRAAPNTPKSMTTFGSDGRISTAQVVTHSSVLLLVASWRTPGCFDAHFNADNEKAGTYLA